MQEDAESANAEVKGSPAPEAGRDTQTASDVFISYASKDAATANAVVAALESQGFKCWIAPRNVIPGSQYADGIVRAINGAKVVVLVLSESAIASPHVGKEIERASSKQRPIIALKTDATESYQVVSQVKITGSHDWTGARAAIDKALQVDPNNESALIADAHLTRTVGNAADALAKFRQTLDRDPLNLLNRRYLVRVLYFAGRLDEAEATDRQVLAMSPSFPAAHYELGRILLAKGRIAAAVSEFEAEMNPGWRQFGLPLGYHAQQRTSEANAALAALLADPAGSEFQVAETYAYFGIPDKAFYWLDRAIDHDPGIQWLRGDPMFNGITADPRYAALLRKLNLSP
jgi:TIR domain/Tetratricopeptide repeat